MSDEAPLVSVVVPTYGRPEYLTEAVESVLGQTYDHVEVVVVDDCSPDPVEPQVAGVDPGGRRLRVVRHEENRGASAARTTGIEESDGAFVAFIDDDDVWLPEKVERQLAAFEDPEVGVVATGLRYEVGGETSNVLRPTLSGDATLNLLYGEPFGTFSTLMVRREVVEAAGTPDERFPCWQDREWPIRLSRHCLVDSIADPLVVHRMGDHGQITDDFEAKRDVAYPLFVETFRPLAAEYGPEAERKLVSTRANVVGMSALKVGNHADACRFARRALRANPASGQAYLILLLSLGGRPLFRTLQRAKRAVVERRKTGTL
ncbi:glycosyltransferase family 2 protein [Halomarina oriensis]|uniref:Glycosyltransferase n=1 Tax=Halomarina oriensis TaxID=671145 RepID=A0A6B0GEG9_9EURY|nr:glycosyltransferase family 2 protein [Halomarina oriensis]MWG33202.1 glycosyltransferase [Halomarina oriensis]